MGKTGKMIQDTVKVERQQQFYMSFTEEIYKVMNSTWKIFSLFQNPRAFGGRQRLTYF